METVLSTFKEERKGSADYDRSWLLSRFTQQVGIGSEHPTISMNIEERSIPSRDASFLLWSSISLPQYLP